MKASIPPRSNINKAPHEIDIRTRFACSKEAGCANFKLYDRGTQIVPVLNTQGVAVGQRAISGFRLVDSRAFLQRSFGAPIEHFAYPFGALSPAIVALVRRAGYASAVTTRSGVARATDDPHALPRLFVHGQHGLGRFLFHLAAGAIRDDRS